MDMRRRRETTKLEELAQEAFSMTEVIICIFLLIMTFRTFELTIAGFVSYYNLQ
jgi:hypothetical protein